ncbi:MAG TPA: YlxR family protein [Virgibacillus sp.]|nr:YlxR family protein [Virgibacillus sp.]
MHQKKRKIPLRKCVVTKEMKPKGELIRVVRTKDGDIFVDPTGKKNGRGAYLSKELSVIEEAEQTKVLQEQFKSEIDASIYEQLREIVDQK